MRKIYESDALVREDEPFAPRTATGDDRPQAARWINASAWSDRLVPHALRWRSIAVRLTVPEGPFAVDESVPFRVEMTNRLPIPVSIKTDSPIVWTWSVDGRPNASHVPLHDPPDRPGRFRFDRGERKRFERRWSGKFRISESEWQPAAPGAYVIRAGINVIDGPHDGVSDEAVVNIVPAGSSDVADPDVDRKR